MKSNNTWKTSVLVAILTMGALRAAPTEPATVKLFVRETPITVLGRTVKVVGLTQVNGEQGYSPEQAKGFHVDVVNQLPIPTSIHWHCLILPNLMDRVPFVTQDPISPGGSRRYDFPLEQSGSYWMHSHYGLQEQQLLIFSSIPAVWMQRSLPPMEKPSSLSRAISSSFPRHSG